MRPILVNQGILDNEMVIMKDSKYFVFVIASDIFYNKEMKM